MDSNGHQAGAERANGRMSDAAQKQAERNLIGALLEEPKLWRDVLVGPPVVPLV